MDKMIKRLIRHVHVSCSCSASAETRLSVGGHHWPLYILWKAQAFELSSRSWSNAGVECAVMWHDEDRQIHVSDKSVFFLKYCFLDAVGHRGWSSQLGNWHPNCAGWLIKEIGMAPQPFQEGEWFQIKAATSPSTGNKSVQYAWMCWLTLEMVRSYSWKLSHSYQQRGSAVPSLLSSISENTNLGFGASPGEFAHESSPFCNSCYNKT